MSHPLNMFNFILFVNYVSIKLEKKNEPSLSVPLQEVKAMILNLSPKLLTLTYDPCYEQMSLLANSIE